jgi:hypothetical protein
MSNLHAPISPSSLALTIACQAWIGLANGLPPEPPTPEAMEGSAADWVRQQYTAGNEVAYGAPIPLPGNFTVTYDMIHGAKLWVATIGYGSTSNVPVVCERIHPSACWGEPDGWTWLPIERRLRLPDYKYGFGLVDVFENWQLIAYAAGLLDTLELIDTDVIVEFIVVQPRAYHRDGPVRRWTVRADHLRTFINEAFNKSARAYPTLDHGSLGPPAEATVGTHCVHCPAKTVCEAYQQHTTRVVEYIGKAQRTAMTAADVGAELVIMEDAAKLLEGRLMALRAQAEGYLRGGQQVVNYGLEPEGGGYRWNEGVTVQELEALTASLGITLRNTITDPHSRKSPVVTPTQALKAGIDAAVIDAYASRTSGGLKLTRQTTNDARRAFGVFTV